MPFSEEFDDVYATIKQSIYQSLDSKQHRCFRFDETKPAGRITGRLLRELRGSSLCIADITELRPNVMWELGFVMALSKPTIILTQSEKELPFDIKDMQCIRYNRTQLGSSLGKPLERIVIDTVSAENMILQPDAGSQEELAQLINEVASLRQMVSQAVALNASAIDRSSDRRTQLMKLEGAWLNAESKTHIYAKLIGHDLVAPYCYRGNDHLDAIYYNWRHTGEYWFAKYKWIKTNIAGFAFMKQTSINNLTGAWWSDVHAVESADRPPKNSGVPNNWKRIEQPIPKWASKLWEKAEKEGLAAVIAKPT